MTYEELEKLVAGKDLSFGLAGQNDLGEDVIVSCEDDDEDPCFHLMTLKKNGWTRHDYIYKSGMVEEVYEWGEL